MAEETTSCTHVFNELSKHLNKTAAKGLDVVYQFDILGVGGGKWYLTIKDGICKVTKGTYPSPTVTIWMSMKDCLDVLTGKVNAQMSFMTGKMRVMGDIGLVIRWQSLFVQSNKVNN